MGRLARKLENHRATRDVARDVFDTRLSQVRADLSAKGLSGRIADRIGEDAQLMLDEAVDIADRNRGIIAGTIAVLMIWIFRAPILAWIGRLIDGNDEEKEASHEQD